jgi:hypothetical protein
MLGNDLFPAAKSFLIQLQSSAAEVGLRFGQDAPRGLDPVIKRREGRLEEVEIGDVVDHPAEVEEMIADTCGTVANAVLGFLEIAAVAVAALLRALREGLVQVLAWLLVDDSIFGGSEHPGLGGR